MTDPKTSKKKTRKKRKRSSAKSFHSECQKEGTHVAVYDREEGIFPFVYIFFFFFVDQPPPLSLFFSLLPLFWLISVPPLSFFLLCDILFCRDSSSEIIK